MEEEPGSGFYQVAEGTHQDQQGVPPKSDGEMLTCLQGRSWRGCVLPLDHEGKGGLQGTEWLFLRSMANGLATVEAGLNAIRQASNASWFEWLKGLALFFWNWGKRYQRLIRDGQPHFVTGPFPVFLKPQKRHQDPAKHELMRSKVVQVWKRGYIPPGKVIGGTHYFCMDKGLDDIRMVYNGTSCGLNEVLWATRFGPPTIKQMLHALLLGYFQCDLDVGEQFLNYPLHTNLREFLGMDVSGVWSADPADS